MKDMWRRFIPCLLLMLVCGGSGFAQGNNLSPALASLAEAERAFAKTSVEKGTREAFITFFADDGINFEPHPVWKLAADITSPLPAEAK